MCQIENEKWEKRNNGRNGRETNQERIGSCAKRKSQIIGYNGSGHNQISINERKNKNRISRKNEKASQNQTLLQKSQQRN